MQERDLRLLFTAGHFDSCRAEPISMSRGWVLKFLTKAGGEEILTLQRAEKEREFKTLDSAASAAKRIGFSWMRVEIGSLEWTEPV